MHGGSHFPIVAFTHNASHRSEERAKARGLRYAEKMMEKKGKGKGKRARAQAKGHLKGSLRVGQGKINPQSRERKDGKGAREIHVAKAKEERTRKGARVISWQWVPSPAG